MSNQLYEEGFYNEEQKLRFLKSKDTDNENTKIAITRILSRAKQDEEKYQRDLYDFNLDQLTLFLGYLNPSTFNSSRTNFYLVRDYISWAISEGLRGDNINPLIAVTTNSFYTRFVDKNKKIIYSKDEIDKIVNECKNPQDGVIVQLIFEGVFGKKDYDELLNLKKDSILPDNRLRLEDGDRQRTIKVSSKCLAVVRSALEQTEYIKRNGNVKDTIRNGKTAKLEENEYVLRNVVTQSKNEGKADRFLVARRIAAIRSYFPDWVRAFNAQIVRNSGMLWMAKELYDEYGKLEKEQYEMIGLQFGLRKVMSNGREYFNFNTIKNDFLNIETINEVYPD